MKDGWKDIIDATLLAFSRIELDMIANSVLCLCLGKRIHLGDLSIPERHIAEWNEGTICKLADAAISEMKVCKERIVKESRGRGEIISNVLRMQFQPSSLGVLADALEEAGMPSDDPIILHLRMPIRHAGSCWAVDVCSTNPVLDFDRIHRAQHRKRLEMGK